MQVAKARITHAAALLASAATLTSLELSGDEWYTNVDLKGMPQPQSKATLVAELPELQHIALTCANGGRRQQHMPFLPAV